MKPKLVKTRHGMPGGIQKAWGFRLGWTCCVVSVGVQPVWGHTAGAGDTAWGVVRVALHSLYGVIELTRRETIAVGCLISVGYTVGVEVYSQHEVVQPFWEYKIGRGCKGSWLYPDTNHPPLCKLYRPSV